MHKLIEGPPKTLVPFPWFPVKKSKAKILLKGLMDISQGKICLEFGAYGSQT